MHRVVARQFALLLFAALWPALAFAINETYEGELIPRNKDTPIKIVLEMKELGEFLTGRVRVSHPLNGDATIDAGRNLAGYCNLASTISSSVSLRLYGNCTSTSFEGYYTIYYTQPRKVARGTFRLTRKVVQSGKGTELSGADLSASYLVTCVKSNARCLTACPRGNTEVEALCANHCRTKFQACKGKASKLANELE